MKKNFKRTCVFIVLALLVTLSLASCQSEEPATATSTTAADTQEQGVTQEPTEETTATMEEPVPVLYLIPGDIMPDEQMVMDAINQNLLDEGLGIYLTREYIPWDVWGDKLNLKFTSGEEFDMFHIMQDWIPYNSYYSHGELADITDYLSEYGQDLLKNVPADMWEGSKLGGRNYIIPTYWIELALDSYYSYRADVFRKYNISIPETPEDILEAYRTVRSDWDGVNKPLLNFTKASYNASTLQLSPKIHRSYDDWPFLVRDAFFQVFQDGMVESWFESEDFKKDCEFMHQAYEEGIIQPDVLSVTGEWAHNYQANGDWLMFVSEDYETTLKNNPDLTVDDLQLFCLAPEKVVMRTWGIKNCNGVSITSKHPEGPVKFVNWLWTNQENYDLYMYGIEGVHWDKDPNNERGVIGIDDPVTNSSNYYSEDWEIGNLKYVRYNANGFMARNNMSYTENPDAINSVAGSFFFDATAIATEYSNVQAEAAVVMTPIVMGVQAYDEYFEAAIQRLKAAGLDAVVEEYQRQLDEFIAAQN